MSLFKNLLVGLALLCPATLFGQNGSATPDAKAKADEAIAKIAIEGSEKFVASFNAGKVDDLTKMFLSNGEYIDEEGTVYQGEKEIKELLTAFFAKFPETKLAINIDSARMAGPLLIEEGTRTMTLKDGATKSRFQFISIRTKSDDGWKYASFRDVADDVASTSHDALEPLSWLAGDWINEGADASVLLTFKWSEEKNFLLGEYQIKSGERAGSKSVQRFGWDPSTGKLRGWIFDSDGGFSEGRGAVTDEGIVFKFSSVNPDGSTASATVTFTKKDKDRFSMKGTDRVVGDIQEDDFEIDIVRRPPTAGK